MTEEKPYFFSIIIPAHNEEKYLGVTLSHVQNLEYPKDCFEVWIIENGSTDKTIEIAKSYETENVFVVSSLEKGVSHAKNLGLQKISPKSDWTILLDADTALQKSFLADLNAFLKNRSKKNYTVGTTSVRPLENQKWRSRAWLRFYDIVHKYGKVSLAIQIARSDLVSKVKFDPALSLGEDLQFIKELRRFGKFFYFPTRHVLTSVRRFEQIGWTKLFLKWTWDSIVWRFYDVRKMDYPVIR